MKVLAEKNSGHKQKSSSESHQTESEKPQSIPDAARIPEVHHHYYQAAENPTTRSFPPSRKGNVTPTTSSSEDFEASDEPDITLDLLRRIQDAEKIIRQRTEEIQDVAIAIEKLLRG